MRNLKHTILAIASIAMVGTLSFFQVSGVSDNTNKGTQLTTGGKTESIKIEHTSETESEDDVSEQAIAEKSCLTSGYAKVTGSTELKTSPSDDAQTIGTMTGAEDLEVLESTEDWYKVTVGDQAGYVKKDFVTLDKKEAETAAKQYDHYKKATVTSENGLIVRSSGSKDAPSVGTVADGEDVIIVDSQNDYIKILFKALGICYLTEFSADICRDCKENAVASAAEVFGKIQLVVLSLPLFESIIESIMEILERKK